MDREVLIFIQAYLPNQTITSEVRKAFLRFCSDGLGLKQAKITITTRVALGKAKCSPRQYTLKNPHGLRNLRNPK